MPREFGKHFLELGIVNFIFKENTKTLTGTYKLVVTNTVRCGEDIHSIKMNG
jgi:hypothetical protein